MYCLLFCYHLVLRYHGADHLAHRVEHECGGIGDLHPVLVAEALTKDGGPPTDRCFDAVLPMEGYCLVGANFDHLLIGVGGCRYSYPCCSQSRVLVFSCCLTSAMIGLCGFKFGKGGRRRSHMLDALQMILMLWSAWVSEVNSNSCNNSDSCNGCNSGKDNNGREEADSNDNGGDNSYSKIKTIYSRPSQYRNTTDVDETRTTTLMRSRRLDMIIRNYAEVVLRLRVFSFKI